MFHIPRIRAISLLVVSPLHTTLPKVHSSNTNNLQEIYTNLYITEFADKKVVLFSVPGAFTPSCSAQHLPGFVKALPELKKKGVDIVACIAFNDAWVMSAWGKANGVKDESILFLSDAGAAFSKSIGWTKGERTSRYAIVIDHGKVIYAEQEPGGDVSVSSAEAVLARL